MMIMKNASRKVLLVVGVAGLFSLSGCSVWMEANRPTPINVGQFVVGENRIAVIEELGNPLSTVTESDGAKCDIYRLYTKGLKPGEKTAIAVGEGAADVVTLGLSEILFTPAESATENKKHPVVFCYKQSKLIRVTAK